ncbi:MAG TPA: glycoside hydrolase family 43 protein, partial [Ktedonobacteraceae bacterium]|nr:glycoside hydrolase family 43 protein [Ktedonobacteraceae bacterium]
NPFWARNFPDPFVLKVRGRYYAYATEETPNPAAGTRVFPILTSTDLVHWQFIGHAMPASGPPYHRYWAPEVTFRDGQFWLYYAVHREGEFTGGIRVAVAERPEGPFTDSGHDLTGAFLPWAIDPHVLRDQDGQWYLYMTIDYWNDPGGLIGSGNAVARLRNPFTLEGPITRVTPPSHQWQLFETQRREKGGVDWYTVEGPAVLQHRGHYYEMFSGGCYYRDNYAVSYAVSPTPMGSEGMQDASWKDWAGPQGNDREAVLIRGDGKHVISPGHNSLVLGPGNTELYTVYHAQQPEREGRFPCLDRLFWHGDEIWTAAPTHLPQPAPALPRVRDLFAHPVLSSYWQPDAGTWHIVDEAVVQQEQSAAFARLQANLPLQAAWLLEVNMRHEAGDGSYGMVFQRDQANRDSLRVSLLSRTLLTLSLAQSPAQPIVQARLPEQTRLHDWHQLLLELNGCVVRVHFDGLPIAEALLPEAVCPFHHFTLYTENCSAAFSGISLTDHFHDEFLSATYTPELLGWQAPLSPGTSTNWRLFDGFLFQSDEGGAQLLLKNLVLKTFECGATMCLQKTHMSDGAAFGMTLWHGTQQYWQAHYTQRQGKWMLELTQWEQSVCCTIAERPLPLTFDPTRWHTLRMRCEHDVLTVHADGPDYFQVAFSEQRLQVGLHTYEAAAMVMDVWQTGL